ncbi:hypothetical protein Rsub_02268 [Raphidocelis subcapitata]|uniref:Uncharacterized protein n=1 Tax=Raphidocelis subcapitata TaxID=307507 RepID=A0A2V0NVF3_9CHLO|nr:hypothetical protein Rsub_02268 [Raphidocelis subcapitata]|eukprot:GBF89550.1 hypothetical protein Rsub_02268 [Raphidocelis subcapitata]
MKIHHHGARTAPFCAALLLAFALLATPAAAASSGRKVLSADTPDATAAAPTPEAPAATPEAPAATPEAAAAAEAPAAPAADDPAAAAADPAAEPAGPPSSPFVPTELPPLTPAPVEPPRGRRSSRSAPLSVGALKKLKRAAASHVYAAPTNGAGPKAEQLAALLAETAPPLPINVTGAVEATSSSQLISPINFGREYDNYRSIYLDRHAVGERCNQGLSGFKLNLNYRPKDRSSAEMRFSYGCIPANARGYRWVRTASQDWGWGSVVFLDRHDLNCGPNAVMNEWRLVRPAGDKLAFDYRCVDVPRVWNCGWVTTPWGADGGGHTNFLDRHLVQCPTTSKSINRWRMQASNNQIRFIALCCQA